MQNAHSVPLCCVKSVSRGRGGLAEQAAEVEEVLATGGRSVSSAGRFLDKSCAFSAAPRSPGRSMGGMLRDHRGPNKRRPSGRTGTRYVVRICLYVINEWVI